MVLQALCIISSPLVNSNWSYSPETPNLVKIRRFLEPCDLDIWQMTLKIHRASLLSNIKLYASFHYHMWIQTGVTVRKRLSWVLTYVTLTFDLWPWPFAWTSLLSLVLTPENFMMIRWWEHSQNDVTDRQTDGQKIPFIKLLGRSYKTCIYLRPCDTLFSVCQIHIIQTGICHTSIIKDIQNQARPQKCTVVSCTPSYGCHGCQIIFRWALLKKCTCLFSGGIIFTQTTFYHWRITIDEMLWC